MGPRPTKSAWRWSSCNMPSYTRLGPCPRPRQTTAGLIAQPAGGRASGMSLAPPVNLDDEFDAAMPFSGFLVDKYLASTAGPERRWGAVYFAAYGCQPSEGRKLFGGRFERRILAMIRRVPVQAFGGLSDSPLRPLHAGRPPPEGERNRWSWDACPRRNPEFPLPWPSAGLRPPPWVAA